MFHHNHGARENPMRSTEFVAELAEVMDVERTELATVDRALAKAGLRQIARGRFHPDITLVEGMRVALGWAASENLTRAAEGVQRLERYFLVENEPRPNYDAEFVALFGAEPAQLRGSGFLDLLQSAASSLSADQYPANALWIEIKKRGGVEISYRRTTHRMRLSFMEATKVEFNTRPKNVDITVRFSGNILKWIFDVTEGA